MTSLSDQQMVKLPDRFIVVHTSLRLSLSSTIDRQNWPGGAITLQPDPAIQLDHGIGDTFVCLLDQNEDGAEPLLPNTLLLGDTFVQ